MLRSSSVRNVFALTTLLWLIGCDEKLEDRVQGDSGVAQDQVEQNLEKKAEKSGVRFLKGMSKKSCEILTPALVAQTFSVPQAELKQLKVMGCIYSWKEGEGDSQKILEANLTMLRAHRKLEDAKTWFNNATANKSEKELKAEMKQVEAKAKAHEDVDTELKKKTVSTIGSIMAEGLKGGVSYEAISGVGDEAKVALADGSIWVRVDNLTFKVNAYKGAPQPKADIGPQDFKNLKKMAAKSMAAQKAWLEETHQERKEASLKLAQVVLRALN